VRKIKSCFAMNSIKKYVVTNSLQTAEWQNSESIGGDVAQKLTNIKAPSRALPLTLHSSETFKSGVLNLSYAPAKE
jgi:hypothetical protein